MVNVVGQVEDDTTGIDIGNARREVRKHPSEIIIGEVKNL